MIGNDIVDLALAKQESDWRRLRYLDKIFTLSEQILIKNTVNQDEMVWNLWSRKEAVYKIYNRQTGIRTYNPIQLECIYENGKFGLVICHGNYYHTKTTILGDHLHTIAVVEESLFDRILYLDSAAVIERKNRIPFIIDPCTNQIKPVSISHHGRYQAMITI